MQVPEIGLLLFLDKCQCQAPEDLRENTPAQKRGRREGGVREFAGAKLLEREFFTCYITA